MRRLVFPLRQDHISVLFMDHCRRPASEKRISRPILSAFHAFQQVGGRAMVDLGKRRDRRFVVRENLTIQRDQIPLFRQRLEILEA